MRQEDLLVEVRDKTLTRVGAIPADLLTMDAEDVHNNVGTWKLQINAEHPLAAVLAAPGAGIIVTGPLDVLFSGPVTRAENATTATDPLGTLSVEGVDDTVILSDMLAWPDPAQGDVTKQSKDTDDRTGPAETLMHAYVNANVGPGAPSNRRKAGLIMGTNSARGASVSKSARFEQLGELCKTLADPAGLGFRVVQRGANLVFETYAVTDRTKDARLGVVNNTLAGQRVSTSTPQKTQVLVGGDGDGTNRVFVGVSTAASTQAETDWGRRIESFVDERSTKAPTELTQKGNEALADGGATVQAAQAVPMEDSALDFGRDWFLGDKVSVIVGNTEMAAVVTGMVLKVDSDGYRLGATLGDPTPLNAGAAAAKAATDLALRVSSLERTAEAVPPGARVVPTTGYTQATPPTSYPANQTIEFYLSDTGATAGGWDFGGKYGFVQTRAWSGGDAVQTWRRVHSSTTPHEMWVRGGNASGWSPWRQVGFDTQLAATSVTQTTAVASYPEGTSTLYLTNTESTTGGWDFGGKWGILTTRKLRGDAVQSWQRANSNSTTETWWRCGSGTGWGPWRKDTFEDRTPRGVVALQIITTASPTFGNADTMCFTQSFTAEAGRCYKVNFRAGIVDVDATGDTTTHGSKQSAIVTTRWAVGPTVATTSTNLGGIYQSTFDDDSFLASGLDASWYLNNPPAGQITLGISAACLKPEATNGKVRFAVSLGASHLVIEDVGAAV